MWLMLLAEGCVEVFPGYSLEDCSYVSTVRYCVMSIMWLPCWEVALTSANCPCWIEVRGICVRVHLRDRGVTHNRGAHPVGSMVYSWSQRFSQDRKAFVFDFAYNGSVTRVARWRCLLVQRCGIDTIRNVKICHDNFVGPWRH